MADKGPMTNKNKSVSTEENDPILQGIDRVQNKNEIDSRLSPETQQGNEDTHTKSNIHLGGRDGEGIATGQEEEKTSVQPQSLDAISPGGRSYPVPDGGTIEPSGDGFAPTGFQRSTEDAFQSSGRATPQVDIEEVAENQPDVNQLEGVSAPNAAGITPLTDALSELENALLPEDENGAPETRAVDLGSTDEDTSRSFSVEDLLSNATDPDGDELIIGDVSINPDFGTIIDNGDGTYTFEPAPDFNGNDLPISYTISDGSATIPGTAIIDVLPVNDPPSSEDNIAVIDEDSSYIFSLDDFAFSDIEGDNFDHITIVDLPANGTLSFDGSPVNPGDTIPSTDLGLLVFTPDANENGDDYATFNFTVNDGAVDSEPYTFSIDVTSINDLPVSADDAAVIEEDSSYTFGLDDFAFSDIEGDNFDHITIVDLPANGTLSFDGNPVNPGDTIPSTDLGLLVFTPDANENGDDYATFDFTVNDGTDDSAQYTFSIDVTPVNDPPASEDNEITIAEDGTHGFSLADFAFTDVDGDNLDHITITELPANGDLTLFGNPVVAGDDIAAGDIVNLLFTPGADASGENYGDFKFTVNDGTSDSIEYDFSIDVTAVADTPDLCLLSEMPETSGLYDISAGGIVTISATYYAAIADVALFENTHGYYVADSDGNPIGGAIIQDNVKEGGNFDISFNTADYPGGVTLGFFVIPDGDTQNLTLEDGDPVTFDLIDGKWTPFLGGVALNGAPSFSPYFSADESLPAFFSDPALNADNYDHLVDNPTLGNQNWEDLVNGGDGDYTDLNAQITVTLQTCDDLEAQGLEGTLIGLPDILTGLNDTDGSESLLVTISNIPEGVTLSDDQGNEFTATDVDNEVDVTGWNLDALSVFSPDGQDDFVVQVTSTATEASNSDEATATRNISVDILHAPETALVDLGSTPEDTGITFSSADLLLNASDEDGDALSISNVAIDPAFGTITDNGDNTYTFNPTADFNGNDLPITYDITDGLVTINGNAIVDVAPVNDAPLTQNALISTIEDLNYVFDEDNDIPFAIGDFAFDDVDGDTLDHITIVDLPEEGTLLLNGTPVAPGTDIPVADIEQLVFAPDPDENGEDYASFNFTVNDGEMDSEQKTITIDVTPVNDAPTSADQEVTTDEDTDYVFSEGDFAFNDIDTANMDHITIIDLPTNGTLSFDGSPVNPGDTIPSTDLGLLVFTPDENENGDDYAAFNFTVNDGELDSDPQTITINVADINDGPVAQDDSNSGDEDTQQTGNVLSNDGDVDGTITVKDTGTFETANGSITIDAAGNYTYTPDANYNGPDSFDYTVIDDDGAEATATLNLTVEDINDGPTAADDSNSGDEDTQQTGNVLGNDTDIDGTISVKDVGTFETANGSITIAANGEYTYTPDANYNGPDSFEYTIIDDDGAEATATLNLTVEDVNDGPVAADDSNSGDEDTQQTGNVLTNDSDVDGTIAVKDTGTFETANGSITIAANGEYTYTPDANYNGPDSFEYTIIDDDGAEATATLNLTVEDINDAPTSTDGTITIDEDEEYTFQPSDCYFDDIDGDSLDHITITELSSNGTLKLNGVAVEQGDEISAADIGNLVFTPDENASGENYGNFKFTVSDGIEESTEHDFVINVTPVADAPSAGAREEIQGAHGLYDISEGGEITVDVSYFSVDAGYNNTHGYYIANSDGEPIAGVVLQDNVKEQGQTTVTFNTDDYPDGVTLGFFIIADGDRQNTGLSDGDTLTFENVGGVWTPYLDGSPLDGAQAAPAYFSDQSLNMDGYDHFEDSGAQGNQNWEDLIYGGDLDHSDVNTDVHVYMKKFADVSVQGDDGTLIELPNLSSQLTDIDGSESLTVTISSIPDGATLSDSHGNTFMASAGDNSVDITSWDMTGLTIYPPAGSSDFNLQMQATSTELANSDTATITRNIAVNIVDVEALHDQDPDVPAGYDETHGNGGGNHIDGDDNGNYIDGEGGNDKLHGQGGSDILVGGSGKDELRGDDGHDKLYGGTGDDTMKGNDGDDTLYGGSGKDKMEGNDGDDTLYGDAGDDNLKGGAGNDNLRGGTGKDTIEGGTGNDLIYGGAGNDKLYGNGGDDTFLFTADEGTDTVDGGAGMSWTDSIELSGFSGLDHEVGWTLVLDTGIIQSTDDAAGEMILSQDADGKIIFDEGGSITFENVEKISW